MKHDMPYGAMLAITATLLSVTPAHAAAPAGNYPSKPIRFIVGFPPGGGGDLVARLIGQALSETYHQTVVIDNRAGAGGVIGSAIVAKAPPDGYTLLLATTGATTISPGLQSKMLYDSRTDFSPVGMIGSFQNVLVVPAASPVKSVKDLVETAKRQPGKVTFASAGVGTTFHMSGEMLKVLAGINIVHVPYKGNGPAMTDLIAGRIDCMFPTLPSALSYLKADRLRAIAVTGPSRASALPDIPTVAESGIAGYRVVNWYGVLAPAGTPPAIVDKLNRTLNDTVLKRADIRDNLVNQGVNIQTTTPAELTTFIRDEVARWDKVIKSAKIKLDESGQ